MSYVNQALKYCLDIAENDTIEVTMADDLRSKVLKKLKSEKKEPKTNFTFRIREELLNQFKADCKKEGISITDALEELIKEFTRFKNAK